MTNKITKAVLPVGGHGTRFLPATKANPKEMLPVVDKPLVQYAAEEAIEAGITELIFVTGRNKRAIADHFDKAYELEMELQAKDKEELLEQIQNIVPKHVTCVYVRQSEALGLGHAVLCAKQVVDDRPFAVILADDLIDAKPGALKRMVELYEAHQCSIIGIENVPEAETLKYGIIDGQLLEDDIYQIRHVVEKPSPGDAPSTLAIVGRYILDPKIFQYLEAIEPGSGNEIQLTDAISSLLKTEKALGYLLHGKRYDCGSKLGYLQATVEYGLKHPELKEKFAEYLIKLKNNLNN